MEKVVVFIWRNVCAVGGVVAMAAFLASCSKNAATPPPVEATGPSVAVATAAAAGEVWIMRGGAAAVPLAAGDLGQRGAKTVRVKRADGSMDAAPVWWLTRHEAAGREGWLGGVWKWSAKTAGEASAAVGSTDGASAWAVVTSAGDVARTGRIVVGSTPVTVHVVNRSNMRPPVESDTPRTGSDGSLREALAPALASPFTAWRARLALGELESGGREEPAINDAGELLTVIDRNESALWHEAISRLRAIDVGVASAVGRRLAAVVTFDDGQRLPIWLQDSETLRQLRADLLSEDLSDAQRVTRVRGWLEVQPPAAAWVCDDAGLRDAVTGEPICTAVFANLSDVPIAASAVVEGTGVAPSGPEMTMVEAGRAVRLRAAAPTGDAAKERTVVVRAGLWMKRLPVLCNDIAARPPGLTIGPLMTDMSNQLMKGASEQGAVLSPAAIAPAADRATVGRLICEQARVKAEKETGRGDEWALYLECLWPASEEIETDRVRVTLGPSSGGPTARVLIAESAKSDGGGDDATSGVRVVRRSDRWVCWIKIPEGAIERDGRLRIGIVREVKRRSNGEIFRSAWPRPLLPTATGLAADPGRLCVDLTAWMQQPGDATGADGANK